MDKTRFGIREIELLPQKGRTVTIYGQAGRGKTTLLNTLKGNILLINTDCGEQVLDPNNPDNSFDICDIVSRKLTDPAKSMQKLKELSKHLSEQEELPWDYIVLDNISEIQDKQLYVSTVKREKMLENPDKLAYNRTGFFMLNLLKELRGLTYKNVHVIYIAWEKTDKIEDFGGEVMSEKSPMLYGQTQPKVDGLVDFVMALRVDKKGNRYLQLDGDHKFSAKKREEPGLSIPSTIECPKDGTDTLHNFFKLLKHEPR